MSAPEYFSEGLSSGRLNSVDCSGTETEILECDHLSSDHGFSCDSAGVVCQGNMPLSLWASVYAPITDNFVGD